MLGTARLPAGPRLAVATAGRSVSTELVCGRELLWSGTWEWEVRCDGQRIEPQGPWEETCRSSDADADYLELQMHCGGGVRLDRHLLLARKDHFLFLADAVLSRRRTNLEYRGSLPLADRIHFHGAKATCEGLLKGTRARALVLPLALPEWRGTGGGGRGTGGGGRGTRDESQSLDSRPSTLDSRLSTLSYRLSAGGSCLFAPLFVDLKPRRLAKPRTWRQLTVAENLTAQPRDVAVGYRVRVGREQWLIYRGLATKGNRTLLGHNLSTEFLVARFLRRGQVESLLEIE